MQQSFEVCPSALKNIGGVYFQDNVPSSLSARHNRFLERRVRPPHACACVSFAHVCLVIIELSGDCGHTPQNPACCTVAHHEMLQCFCRLLCIKKTLALHLQSCISLPKHTPLDATSQRACTWVHARALRSWWCGRLDPGPGSACKACLALVHGTSAAPLSETRLCASAH
jgi:hypothetical protein